MDWIWSSGGKPKEGESEEITLHREVREEIGIEITDLLKFEEIRLDPTKKIDGLTTFIVKPYIARALSTKIMPNKEISGWKWFDPRVSLKEEILGPIRKTIESYLTYLSFNNN